MLHVVRAEVRPIPEFTEGTELLYDGVVAGAVSNSLPGIIIRAVSDPPDFDAARALHEQRVESVGDALSRLVPAQNLQTRRVTSSLGTALSDRAVGPMHHDVRHAPDLPTVNVHTTVAGSGGVLLANFGSDRERAMAADIKYSLRDRRLRHPHMLARLGLVDPEIVEPVLYRGHVRTGDSVVFIENGPGAKWHRFDTDRKPFRGYSRRRIQVTIMGEQA
jgi:hypothetical protein